MHMRGASQLLSHIVTVRSQLTVAQLAESRGAERWQSVAVLTHSPMGNCNLGNLLSSLETRR